MKDKMGVQSGMFDKDSLELLRDALETLAGGFAALPSATPPSTDERAMSEVLSETAARLLDNFPYFHPCYAGQMLKPPHPVARLAYALAMWINPNNHALDGGRASSVMEKESVAAIARMFGWETHLGHLCGGGTMANLEALWVAGRLDKGNRIVASDQAHYTHRRICGVLGLQFEAVPCDLRGRMDAVALAELLDRGGIGTVVATLGTTATGAVDPLPRIIELRERYGFRLHVDAAYGGYFTLAGDLAPDTRAAFDLIGEADSIVIDPHKHGLQPYGCGCVLFHDPAVGRFYKHDSPYTYFSSGELHLGEISLECSRPGAAAVALWATHRLLPLEPGGEFARMLGRSRAAALGLYEKLRVDERFLTAFAPELDIVIWLPRAASASEASEIARAIFNEAARRHLHLALAELPAEFFGLDTSGMENGAAHRSDPGDFPDPDRHPGPEPGTSLVWQEIPDRPSGVRDDMEDAGVRDDRGRMGDQVDEPKPSRVTVTCLRSVLMKPEHIDWLDRIWEILDESTNTALERRK